MFRRLGTRGICEMISDGGERFIPADIVGVHTLSLLPSSRVAHDRATEDDHTHEVSSTPRKKKKIAGTVHKPRQEGIKSVPL